MTILKSKVEFIHRILSIETHHSELIELRYMQRMMLKMRLYA